MRKIIINRASPIDKPKPKPAINRAYMGGLGQSHNFEVNRAAVDLGAIDRIAETQLVNRLASRPPLVIADDVINTINSLESTIGGLKDTIADIIEPLPGETITRTDKTGQLYTVDSAIAELGRKYGSTTPGGLAEYLGLDYDAGYTLGLDLIDASWENDGDIYNPETPFKCDDLGAVLDYNLGLKQVPTTYTQTSYTKPDGTRGYLRHADDKPDHYYRVANWLANEATHRHDAPKADKYRAIAIQGGYNG